MITYFMFSPLYNYLECHAQLFLQFIHSPALYGGLLCIAWKRLHFKRPFLLLPHYTRSELSLPKGARSPQAEPKAAALQAPGSGRGQWPASFAAPCPRH